jgi:hypothetical protein
MKERLNTENTEISRRTLRKVENTVKKARTQRRA